MYLACVNHHSINIGGGGIYVPLFILVATLSPQQAVPRSACTMLGLGILNFVANGMITHLLSTPQSVFLGHSKLLVYLFSLSLSHSHSLPLTLFLHISSSHSHSLTRSLTLSHSHSLTLSLSFSLSLFLSLFLSYSHAHALTK